jgi:hypothetical protein
LVGGGILAWLRGSHLDTQNQISVPTPPLGWRGRKLFRRNLVGPVPHRLCKPPRGGVRYVSVVRARMPVERSQRHLDRACFRCMSRSGGRERRVLFRRVGSSTLLHLYLLLCCVASLPVCDVPPATRSAPGVGGEFGGLWCIVRCGQSGRGNILARIGVQAGGAAVIHGAVAFNVSTLF